MLHPYNAVEGDAFGLVDLRARPRSISFVVIGLDLREPLSNAANVRVLLLLAAYPWVCAQASMRHETGIPVCGPPGTRPPGIRHAIAIKDCDGKSERVDIVWDGRNRRSHRTT